MLELLLTRSAYLLGQGLLVLPSDLEDAPGATSCRSIKPHRASRWTKRFAGMPLMYNTTRQDALLIASGKFRCDVLPSTVMRALSRRIIEDEIRHFNMHGTVGHVDRVANADDEAGRAAVGSGVGIGAIRRCQRPGFETKRSAASCQGRTVTSSRSLGTGPCTCQVSSSRSDLPVIERIR